MSAGSGTAIIKMGVFARSNGYGKDIEKPVAQVYTKNRKEWEPLIDGVFAAEEMPPQ